MSNLTSLLSQRRESQQQQAVMREMPANHEAQPSPEIQNRQEPQQQHRMRTARGYEDYAKTAEVEQDYIKDYDRDFGAYARANGRNPQGEELDNWLQKQAQEVPAPQLSAVDQAKAERDWEVSAHKAQNTNRTNADHSAVMDTPKPKASFPNINDDRVLEAAKVEPATQELDPMKPRLRH